MHYQVHVKYKRNNAVLVFGIEAKDVIEAARIADNRIPKGDMSMDIVPILARGVRNIPIEQTLDDRE